MAKTKKQTLKIGVITIIAVAGMAAIALIGGLIFGVEVKENAEYVICEGIDDASDSYDVATVKQICENQAQFAQIQNGANDYIRLTISSSFMVFMITILLCYLTHVRLSAKD